MSLELTKRIQACREAREAAKAERAERSVRWEEERKQGKHLYELMPFSLFPPVENPFEVLVEDFIMMVEKHMDGKK